MERFYFGTRAILLISASLLFASCGEEKKEKKPPSPEELSRKVVQEILSASKVKLEELEKIGIKLEDIQRNCNHVNQGDFSKAIKCAAKKQKELLQKNGLSPERLSDIRNAHVNLKWELKYFLKENATDVKSLKEIYSKCMSELNRCEKEITERFGTGEKSSRKIRDCTDKRIYKICSESSYKKGPCEKIISMGVDYGWTIAGNKVIQKVNPNIQLKTKKEQ